MTRIKLTDLQSERQISGHTKDPSLFGCFAVTTDLFPEGTKIRLTISRGETHLVAQGRVNYSRPCSGMGIAFTTVEPNGLLVLDLWLAGVRKRQPRSWTEPKSRLVALPDLFRTRTVHGR
jgi:hypothetical protein